MKAIYINSKDRTVTEVDLPKGIDAIYQKLECDTFDCVGIRDNDAIFVDDEGLLKEQENFFCWAGYSQPLAGHGLIVGCDDEGESVDCKISLADAASKVLFVSRSELERFMPGSTDAKIEFQSF